MMSKDLVTLKYQIDRLPSSQHRAGLAGLILKIQWLQIQSDFEKNKNAVLKIIDLDPDRVTIKLNQLGLTLLLNSHYHASFEDRESKKPRPKSSQQYQTIEREVYNPSTDCNESIAFYIYRDLVPTGHLIRSFDPTRDENLIWTKLWQETTWSIFLPRTLQRLPFTAVASGTEPPKIEKIWNLLRDSPDKIVDLSSTDMLGVQSKNNEGIKFVDQANFYLLLHFWIYIAQIYLPFSVDVRDEIVPHGYAIAIPDIRNLAAFCLHFRAILQRRSTKIRWYKPKEAIVCHSIEAGLYLLRSIHIYLRDNPDLPTIDRLLFGVDVFHIYRRVNKKEEPQILNIQRYPADPARIAEFDRVENHLFDPTVRRQYWQNLTNDRPRIFGFDRIIAELPTSKTIGNDWFCRDFKTLFHPRNTMEPEDTNTDAIDPSPTHEISLEQLILRLMRKYTSHKLKTRYGMEWKEVWNEQTSEQRRQDRSYLMYKEKRESVVKDLHGELHHYRDSERFLKYFAQTFTGIYQYLTTQEYLFLAQQIQTQPERIQILCWLALPVL